MNFSQRSTIASQYNGSSLHEECSAARLLCSHPSADAVERSDAFWDDLERGHARYVVMYEASQPAGIHFVGYSFD